MNSYLNILLALLLLAGCNQTQTPQKYSIETLMSNNRSSGGYFSKDGGKLLYSSDKSGIFNLYEIELNTYTENQLTTSTEESFFARGYSPTTGEVIYSADSGGNENSHLYLIRNGKSLDLTPGEQKPRHQCWGGQKMRSRCISNYFLTLETQGILIFIKLI